MFTAFETFLTSLVHTLPLEWFVFVASFVEEVIAPIPSPTVMMLSGSFASLQGYTLQGLIVLAVLGALGKTVGALVVYYVARTFEDILVPRFGRFFGITQNDIDRLASKIGNTWKDYVLLTFFRALPIIPSSIVSVGCGLLTIKPKIYIISTFIGTIIRDGVYLYAGYIGTDMFKKLIDHSTTIESFVEYSVLFFVLFVFGFLWYRRKQRGKSHDKHL